MGLNNFRAYAMAVTFYQIAKTIALPHVMKDQLVRAAASVPLNLSEGSAKPSRKDRRRFYLIAFASLREVQAIIDCEPDLCAALVAPADALAANLYKLTKALA